MAKALFGHIAGPDPRAAAEIAALRGRIRELEGEVAALRAERLAVPAALSHDLDDELRTLDAIESGVPA